MSQVATRCPVSSYARNRHLPSSQADMAAMRASWRESSFATGVGCSPERPPASVVTSRTCPGAAATGGHGDSSAE